MLHATLAADAEGLHSCFHARYFLWLMTIHASSWLGPALQAICRRKTGHNSLAAVSRSGSTMQREGSPEEKHFASASRLPHSWTFATFASALLNLSPEASLDHVTVTVAATAQTRSLCSDRLALRSACLEKSEFLGSAHNCDLSLKSFSKLASFSCFRPLKTRGQGPGFGVQSTMPGHAKVQICWLKVGYERQRWFNLSTFGSFNHRLGYKRFLL